MLGKTEELIMMAAHKAGPKSTASEIFQTLENVVGKTSAFGAIFTTLERLSKKGFLEFQVGAVRKEYGNKAPREYSVTGEGMMALSESIAVTEKMRRTAMLPNGLHGAKS
jgi:PadR family transcriptional regulator, regulatory protein PadR